MKFFHRPVTSMADVTHNFEQLELKDVLNFTAENFLQLLTAGTVAAATGRLTLTWPGASAMATGAAATHNLGRSPLVVLLTPGAISDANYDVVPSHSTLSTTQVFINARAVSHTPANGVTCVIHWLAIG